MCIIVENRMRTVRECERERELESNGLELFRLRMTHPTRVLLLVRRPLLVSTPPPLFVVLRPSCRLSPAFSVGMRRLHLDFERRFSWPGVFHETPTPVKAHAQMAETTTESLLGTTPGFLKAIERERESLLFHFLAQLSPCYGIVSYHTLLRVAKG